MKRKRKQPGLTITLTPQDAPTRPGYYWLHHPWSSFNGPVDVRPWSTGWQVFVVGSLYPLRQSQHYDGATWYWLGDVLEVIQQEAHEQTS